MKGISPELKRSINNLPHKPGVYQFYDKDSKLLYVGKAKKLRNRVGSYFSKQKYESGKTRLMVSKISRVEYIVVNHEYEALLLENTLIKKNQPRYNVMLRDDKTYPWLCLKNERFPRVFATRKLIEDGSE
jgi:excinuclease ABC subunit C